MLTKIYNVATISAEVGMNESEEIGKKVEILKARIGSRLNARFLWACVRVGRKKSDVLRDVIESTITYVDVYCAPTQRWITPELRPMAAKKRKPASAEVVTSHVTVQTNHGKVLVTPAPKHRAPRKPRTGKRGRI